MVRGMQTDLTATISGASARTAIEKMLREDGPAPLDARYVIQTVRRARECGTDDETIRALFGFTAKQVAAVPR